MSNHYRSPDPLFRVGSRTICPCWIDSLLCVCSGILMRFSYSHSGCLHSRILRTLRSSCLHVMPCGQLLPDNNSLSDSLQWNRHPAIFPGWIYNLLLVPSWFILRFNIFSTSGLCLGSVLSCWSCSLYHVPSGLLLSYKDGSSDCLLRHRSSTVLSRRSHDMLSMPRRILMLLPLICTCGLLEHILCDAGNGNMHSMSSRLSVSDHFGSNSLHRHWQQPILSRRSNHLSTLPRWLLMRHNLGTTRCVHYWPICDPESEGLYDMPCGLILSNHNSTSYRLLWHRPDSVLDCGIDPVLPMPGWVLLRYDFWSPGGLHYRILCNRRRKNLYIVPCWFILPDYHCSANCLHFIKPLIIFNIWLNYLHTGAKE